MTSYLNSIDPEDEYSIMRLRDKFIFRGHQCLVLELLSFSLYELLNSTDFYGVSLNLVRKFCKQILKCLSFLSRKDVNIIHCDLKPENVLLRHPQRSAIKVVDFGASCKISDDMFIYVQSRFYRAPEVILGLPYNTQIDIWSLGCMLIELHTGYPVFAGKDESDQIAIIVERLGLPPKNMLRNGKKTKLFFDQIGQDEWELKPSILKQHDRSAPGSKPIKAFIDYHTGTNGKRKRASGGHSEDDYDVFLRLAMKMLRYDPEERITAAVALEDDFSKGAPVAGAKSSKISAAHNTERNAHSVGPGIPHGKDSPPPMPAGVSPAVGGERTNVDPGRKAPLHRRMPGIDDDAPDDAVATSNPVVPTTVSASSSTAPLATNTDRSIPNSTSRDHADHSLATSSSAVQDKSSESLGAPSSQLRSASDMAAASGISGSASSTSLSTNLPSTMRKSSTATSTTLTNGSAGNNDVLLSSSPAIPDPQMDQPVVDNADSSGIRASKSEPTMEAMIVAKKNTVFQASDWAEEVGIEPPPWRSGGRLVAADDEELMRNVPRSAAGGGCELKASTFSVAGVGIGLRPVVRKVTFAPPPQQQRILNGLTVTASRRRYNGDEDFRFGRDVGGAAVATTGITGPKRISSSTTTSMRTESNLDATSTSSISTYKANIGGNQSNHINSSSNSISSQQDQNSHFNRHLDKDRAKFQGKGLMRKDDANKRSRRAISFGHGDATPLLFGRSL